MSIDESKDTTYTESPVELDEVYWYLTVIHRGNKKYTCRCVCGAIKEVGKYDLKHGKTKSCGCKRKELMKKTSQERYNCDSWHSSPEGIEKEKKRCMERYGAEYYFLTDEFKQKAASTCLQKYGHTNAMSDPGVQKLQQQGVQKSIGVTSPLQNKEILEKVKRTRKEKYGYEHMLQNPESKKKFLKTHEDNYGPVGSEKRKEISRKRESTVQEKHGVSNISQLQEIKDKKIATSLVNYGVEYPIQAPGAWERVWKVKMANPKQAFHSKDEIRILEFVKQFDPEASQACCGKHQIDILSKSRKTAIEYCGNWWHCDKAPVPKDSFYHVQKQRTIRSIQDIDTVFIWEYEWVANRAGIEQYLYSLMHDTCLNNLSIVDNCDHISLFATYLNKKICALYNKDTEILTLDDLYTGLSNEKCITQMAEYLLLNKLVHRVLFVANNDKIRINLLCQSYKWTILKESPPECVWINTKGNTKKIALEEPIDNKNYARIWNCGSTTLERTNV